MKGKNKYLELHFTPFYDDNLKLVKTIQKSKGTNIDSTVEVISSYSYLNDTIIKTGKHFKETEVKDRLGKVIFLQHISYLPPTDTAGNTNIYNWKRNKQGQPLEYQRFRDGVLKKKTVHFYKNGLETHRVEYFYQPDYQVHTTFKYKHWE